MIVEDFSFTVDGTQVAACLTLPDGVTGAIPGAFTAPGFAGVKEMLIPAYAEDFAKRGVAHLAFDYPGFGGSDGAPRQQVDPPLQLRTFVAAFDAFAAHPSVDADRVGAWGTSMSGGHSIAVAYERPQIKAVAAVIPFIKMQPSFNSGLLKAIVSDQLAALRGRPRLTIPVAGHPGEVAAMNSDGAFEWAADMAKDAPTYQNVVTVASLPKVLGWSIGNRIPSNGVPILAVLAEQDSITPPARVRNALSDVRNVEWASYPQTHFELFTSYGEDVRTRVVSWLCNQLTDPDEGLR